MFSSTSLSLALVSLLQISAASTSPGFLSPRHHLFPRADEAGAAPQPQPQEVCADLSVSSNNGDRKVVIVIDRSGSMADNDPTDRRLIAAQALNDFLISNSEGGKPDQVAVVGFDYSAATVFGPGDPGDPDADQAISNITLLGGTFIAGGVLLAIDEINKMSGDTKDKSAIVVFTDGEDSSTSTLVDAIKNATSQGIRVSFGFLDLSFSSQPPEVLLAVRESKGLYATITLAEGTRNFVNYVILNGLTYQDNPQGAGDRLLAGLGTTQLIDGSNAVNLKYSATQGERANFTLVSITGDQLTMEAKMNGQTLNSSDSLFSFSDTVIEVEPPGSGEVEVIVTAKNNPVDGLFSVVTNSNQPIKNCTVGVSGGGSGLSAGAKAGLGVGLTALLLGLAGAGFWAYKHFHLGAPAAGGGGAPSAPPHANTTSLPTGAEKMGAHTNVYPVDPSHMNGLAPTGGEQGMNHTMLPPDHGASTGQALTAGAGAGGGGGAPQGFAPLGSGPAPPAMGVPPTGGVPPPEAMAGLGSVPNVFLPPLVPPNIFGQKPGGSGSKPGTPNPDGVSPQHSNFNVPPQDGSVNHTSHQNPNANHFLSNAGGAQQPLGGFDGVQHSLPPGGGEAAGGNPSGMSPGSGTSYSNTYHNHTGGHVNTGNYSYNMPPPQQPLAPGVGGINNPGFTMPGTQVRMGFGAGDGRQEEKHHHHPWLAPDSACEHPECPLNLASHRCVSDTGSCECDCRDAGCPYLRSRG
ncbi:von Willebrand factor type A domain-containing protein [Rhypophila decipiens]|uniref:von Willebrand factor type A domain-containing protein n=1 Tax=Rhypophila decipiens TaxID=261697 RepID=A0AAN6YIE0_9PEZI|nr:von Willebrand factor type A domain-containing protein [Rhypophila decipiens]